MCYVIGCESCTCEQRVKRHLRAQVIYLVASGGCVRLDLLSDPSGSSSELKKVKATGGGPGVEFRMERPRRDRVRVPSLRERNHGEDEGEELELGKGQGKGPGRQGISVLEQGAGENPVAPKAQTGVVGVFCSQFWFIWGGGGLCSVVGQWVEAWEHTILREGWDCRGTQRGWKRSCW